MKLQMERIWRMESMMDTQNTAREANGMEERYYFLFIVGDELMFGTSLFSQMIGRLEKEQRMTFIFLTQYRVFRQANGGLRGQDKILLLAASSSLL
mmetsp:Transcript_17005/g.34906  ORF Transcript_17005/g.34906 Transcript_17005/m.34906 type:complete len:96 (+) Transcript_17005:938-1225(+)